MRQIVDRWITYLREVRKIKSSETLKGYKTSINRWIGVYECKHGAQRSLLKADKQDFYHFVSELEKTDMRISSIKLRLAHSKLFYDWLEATDQIERAPYPKDIPIGGKESKEYVHVTDAQIFRIRQKIGFRLEQALAFELLLSSGLRLNEMLQLRFCDISMNRVPIDKETGVESVYCGGTLDVNSYVQRVKRNKSRTTYISKLASRLLCEMIAIRGIETDSVEMILPWAERSVLRWFRDLGKNVITEPESEKPKTSNTMEEIDLDSVNNPKFKDLMKKRMDQIRKKIDSGDEEVKDGKPDRGTEYKLHPHAMRNFFASCMHFRNYHGEQANMERLQKMMGHNQASMTFRYMANVNCVSSLDNWKRLMIGRASDWNVIKE